MYASADQLPKWLDVLKATTFALPAEGVAAIAIATRPDRGRRCKISGAVATASRLNSGQKTPIPLINPFTTATLGPFHD